MPFKRETIVLASAIIGANLFGILTNSKAATSNGLCDGISRIWQAQQTSRPDPTPRTDIPYWENNPWAAPATQPRASSTVAPASPPPRTQNRPPATGGAAPISGTLINGMTEPEYQAKRRAIAVQMGGQSGETAPRQTAYSCSWYKGKKYCGEG